METERQRLKRLQNRALYMDYSRPDKENLVPIPYHLPVAQLREIIKGNPDECWAAFAALAHCPGDEALDVLKEAAASPDPYIRRAAIETIGKHPDGGRLAGVILKGFQDESEYVCRSSCEAAGILRLVESRGVLHRLLSDNNSSTRIAAISALEKIWSPEDFKPVFQVYKKDASDTVRKEAAEVLYRTVDAEHASELIEAWIDEPNPKPRTWACRLTAQFILREYETAMLKLAEDKNGHVRKAAHWALNALKAG